MNFVKRSLVGGTKSGVIALGGVRALLLPALDPLAGPWASASLFSSPARLTEVVIRGLWLVARDPGAITKDGGLNVILPNRLADPLGMELLEL